MIPNINQICPAEILSHVFSFLPPEDLARSERVCKLWKEYASSPSLWEAFDLQNLFSKNLRILDEKTWKTHADLDISVDDVPPLDKRRMIVELTKFYSLLNKGKQSIREDKSVTILTIPKNLSLDALEDFVHDKNIKVDIEEIIEDLLGEKNTDRTYRVIITNDILLGSDEEKWDLEIPKKMGLQTVRLLDVATLTLLTYVSSTKSPPERLYSNDAPGEGSMTRCAEKINGRQVEVGLGLTDASHITPNVPNLQISFCSPDTGTAVRLIIRQ